MTASQVTQHINKLAFAFKYYFVCDLSLTLLINELVKKYKYFFFTSLSLSLIGEWVSTFKYTGDFIIWALCSDHMIGKFRCYTKMAKTHILLAHPTLKNDSLESLSISGTLFSVVSLFWSHSGTWIQIDFCSAHVQTLMRDVMWWLQNVMGDSV